MVDFYAPRLKTERAEHHIGDLERIFRDYTRRNVQRLRRQEKGRPLKKGATLPKHTSTVLGDALHNLRASLDHAYHIAADANAAKPSRHRSFPFGKDRKPLEDSIKGHAKLGITPSQAVIDAILNDIQPYEGGKLDLYGVHALDITDKHEVLIPTMQLMRTGEGVEFPGGAMIKGVTLVTHSPHGEFISPGSGAKLHGDPKTTFQICFQQGQPYEGQSILETVKRLHAHTNAALDILERAI